MAGQRASLVISSVLALAFVAVQIYILHYIFQLETIGCKCARDFRRTYAQVYLISSFVVPLIQAGIAASATERTVHIVRLVQLIISLLWLGAGVAYIVFVWQYISRMRSIKCACSEAVARDVWEVVTYIQAAVLVLFVFMLLILSVNLVGMFGAAKTGKILMDGVQRR